MAEQPTTTETNTGAKPPQEGGALNEGGIKALHAERDARKQAERTAADLQKQIDALNAEKLTDLEKAQQAAKAAEDERDAARVEALRFKVAAANGITAEDAELLLTATTEEAMTAQAKRLAERTPDIKTPKPDLSQGGGGGKSSPGTTGEQFANFIESKLN